MGQSHRPYRQRPAASRRRYGPNGDHQSPHSAAPCHLRYQRHACRRRSSNSVFLRLRSQILIYRTSGAKQAQAPRNLMRNQKSPSRENLLLAMSPKRNLNGLPRSSNGQLHRLRSKSPAHHQAACGQFRSRSRQIRSSHRHGSLGRMRDQRLRYPDRLHGAEHYRLQLRSTRWPKSESYYGAQQRIGPVQLPLTGSRVQYSASCPMLRISDVGLPL